MSAPYGVAASVFDDAGVFIANLPHAKGLRWLNEHNTAGAGSVDYRRYDALEAEKPNLWDPGNQILIRVGGTSVFRLILDAEGGYRIDAAGNRQDTWTGSGALGILNSGMVQPEYGWREEATEERSFDYGSNPNIGGWFVPAEWGTPVGKLLRESWRWTYKKRHLPKGFKDKKAQWLWWQNPDNTSTSNETCYFISSFTLSQARRVRFKVAGDDTLEFQVDGEVRITAGPGGWKKASKLVMWLSPGVHYVAAKVTNKPGSTGNANRSGFIASIARINGDGDVVEVLRRTTPGTWQIRRQLGSSPGWFPAQILRQLVQEQKDGGYAGHAAVTFGFTTTTDSAGVPHSGERQERSLRVGTEALDYVQQIVEMGVDVAMTPEFQLNEWATRGVDRSATVRLDQGMKRRLDESAPQLPAIRNEIHARASTGWVAAENTASIAARGRRAAMVSLGSSRSPEQSVASIAAMLPDLAEPPQTHEVKLSSTSGPQPHVDFDIADWVSYRPAGANGRRRFRVMSIGGEGTEQDTAAWTVKLYEDPA